MSSIPGYTLEEYLAWYFSIIVEDLGETNFSVGMAEALGNIAPRPVVNKELFAKVVAYFEPHRESVENRLSDFDEESQSWRDYAGYAFDFIPESMEDTATAFIKLSPYLPGLGTLEDFAATAWSKEQNSPTPIRFNDEWLQRKLEELKSAPDFQRLYHNTWTADESKSKDTED